MAKSSYKRGAELRQLRRECAEYEHKMTEALALCEQVDTKLKEQDAKLVEAERNVGFWKRQWTEADAALKKVRDEAMQTRLERDNWRTQAETYRGTANDAQQELHRARGYVEGLLDGMHPRRPQLPWEGEVLRGTYEHVGSVGRAEMFGQSPR